MKRGIDISTFQDSPSVSGRIDFAKAKNYGIDFVINRAIFGTYKDDDFDYNWNAEKDQGYLRGSYGFWDYRHGSSSTKDQATAYANIIKNDFGEFPVAWMDFEHPISTWPSLPSREICLKEIEIYIKTVEDITGKLCGIYTRPDHLKNKLAVVPEWLRKKPLWIAAWPLVPTGFKSNSDFYLEEYIDSVNWKPNLYGQWDNWMIWQYGTPSYGYKYGMESREIDVDYFNDEVYGDILNPVFQIPIIEKDENEKGGYTLELKVIAPNGLNVRSGPSTSYSRIKSLPVNSKVTVYDVSGKYGAWVKIDDSSEQWCCVEDSQMKYMKKS